SDLRPSGRMTSSGARSARKHQGKTLACASGSKTGVKARPLLALRAQRLSFEQKFEDRFLRVQAVAGLLERGRLRAVEHFVGDLLAAVCRQAVKHARVLGRLRQQGGVELVR